MFSAETHLIVEVHISKIDIHFGQHFIIADS
jgi:hypothetical protein